MRRLLRLGLVCLLAWQCVSCKAESMGPEGPQAKFGDAVPCKVQMRFLPYEEMRLTYLELKRERGVQAVIDRFFRFPDMGTDRDPVDRFSWPLEARPGDPRIAGVYPSWRETTCLICTAYVLVELEGVLSGEVRGGKDDKVVPYMAKIVAENTDAPRILSGGVISREGYCRLVKWFNKKISSLLIQGAIAAWSDKSFGPFRGLPLEDDLDLQGEMKLYASAFEVYAASIPKAIEGRQRGSAIVVRRKGVELWRRELVQIAEGEMLPVRIESLNSVGNQGGRVQINARAHPQSALGSVYQGVNIVLGPSGELLFYTLIMD